MGRNRVTFAYPHNNDHNRYKQDHNMDQTMETNSHKTQQIVFLDASKPTTDVNGNESNNGDLKSTYDVSPLLAANGIDENRHQAEAAAAGKVTSASAPSQAAKTDPIKTELAWRNIIIFVILHSLLPIGLYMLFFQRPWKTIMFGTLCGYASGLGITGGSHRLWSHRAYKAKWPVQVLLTILQTMAGQASIYTWSRDHRVHHKYSETDADPYNIKRGFFFAHIGWLCCRKHPDVREKGKLIDMSDLEANPYVMFQHRNYWWLALVFTVLVPTMVPVLLWQEHFWRSFMLAFLVRYVALQHCTYLVNSAAHYSGLRPYDRKIGARETAHVIFNGLGEGFHNYHHTFPYDYAASEFGRYMNITTAFIDLCASLGLVYDRRKANSECVLKRRMRTGDLSAVEETEERQQASRLKRNRGRKTGVAKSASSMLQLRRFSIGLHEPIIEKQDEQ